MAKCHVCGFRMPLQFIGNKFTDKEIGCLLTHVYTSQIMLTNRPGHESYGIIVRGKGLADAHLSERLGISPRTLQDFYHRGIIPFYRLDGKILYEEKEIEEYLSSIYIPKY